MKIVQISDLHNYSDLINKISEDIETADLIILSGDITHFGHKNEAIQLIEKFKKYNKNIFEVTGNCDYPEFYRFL